MGFFITFEGIDGAGKTTQIDLLRQKYPNWQFTRNPGGTLLGQKLRNFLLKDEELKLSSTAELLLYMADRAQHVQEIIKPVKTQSNHVLICDRFIDSTLAYQGYGRNLDLDIIKNLNFIAIENTEPDLTVLFDLKPEIAITRLGKLDKIEQEGLEFLQKVRDGYLKIAQENQARFKIIEINHLSPEEVFEQLEKIILDVIK